ncbi:Inositol 2-dehydrogenase/D-chiro-inositol 3-dehydrogenase [Paenibacillus plantiphilus]|uniref:Inositol 2-dehydrogenase/D-chiro-inositol 3-dehydrogenase n=1 Tax=Paenibacillus plantiphilus TaxID=2905650 RepID=A0ABM9BTY8_9BACL|nr:Gfo/Idh/MocA family oxidoreductase [Paenibacillus plantiphilus]CAH1192858.1 Inositol 2-dehydrogenase/D-chiro-inositol 3-dehydrogenase [Paenibacillus plantiphilus]
MTKICVIGLGPMGKRHLLALRKIENAEICSVVDLREDTLRMIGEEFSISESCRFQSHIDAIRISKPDIVAIATNGPSHYSIFEDLVRSGVKQILCEKPLATSLRDAQNMADLAKKHRVRLLVNHPRRWCSDYIALKGKLRNGIIGKIESFSFTMGGGQMGCNGTHFIDLFMFLSGYKVKSVVGFLNDENVPNPRGVQFADPGGYAIFHLFDDTRVFFELTEDIGIPPMITINGTYGRILIEETKGYYTIERRDEETINLPVTRYGTPLTLIEQINFEELDIVNLTGLAYSKLMVDEFENVVNHAIDALEAIISIHDSHEQGNRKIQLPLQGDVIRDRRFLFT